MSKWKLDSWGVLIDEDGKNVLSEIAGSREQIAREHNAHDELVNALESIYDRLCIESRPSNMRTNGEQLEELYEFIDEDVIPTIESALHKSKGNE